MRRIWISPAGEVRTPSPEENSHFDMAMTILKAAHGQDCRGDVEDVYAAMWFLGWIRAVDYGDRVRAELRCDGQPVSAESLPAPQQQRLENQVRKGKQVRWNDAAFALSRERGRTVGP